MKFTRVLPGRLGSSEKGSRRFFEGVLAGALGSLLVNLVLQSVKK
jgi:hypothetical protein